MNRNIAKVQRSQEFFDPYKLQPDQVLHTNDRVPNATKMGKDLAHKISSSKRQALFDGRRLSYRFPIISETFVLFRF
jgi:hypothetical protein